MRCIFIYCLAVLLTVSCKKNTPPIENVLPANKPPVANAGPDTTLILPNTHITLDGSKSFDPDNRPLTYKWRKISGPYSNTLSNPLNSDPPAIGINCYMAGDYLFELTVSNSIGISAKDTVKISVVHSPFTEHNFDRIFDINSTCKIEGNFPGNIYDGANFRLYAESNVFSETASIDQEYEKYSTPYFYRANLTITNGRNGSIFLYFLSPQVFFTLPYNSGPATLSDSVTVVYGDGVFANINNDTRLYCSVTADTVNHTGKIILKGSIFY